MTPTEPILWVVLFNALPQTEEYLPVVPYLPTTPFLHGLDPNVVPALEAIWWCLHLPPNYGHCHDLDASNLVAIEELDGSHKILLFPSWIPESQLNKISSLGTVGLVITPDNAREDGYRIARSVKPFLGLLTYSALSQDCLNGCWTKICAIVGDRGVRCRAPRLTPLSEGAAERLSLIFRARQFTPVGSKLQSQLDKSPAQLTREALSVSQRINATALLERAGCRPEEFDSRFPKAMETTWPHFPLTVGSAGVASIVKKLVASVDNAPPSGLDTATIEDERGAIDILVAHHAVGHSGFGMRLPDIPAKVFAMLRDLERVQHAERSNRRKNRVMLDRIGKTLGMMLTPEQQFAIRVSRTITAFTDFPWGLAILPGDSSPISTSHPVIYRPLTPLTRALQFEVSPRPSIYFGNGFSVLIAECLEDGDRIRRISEVGWKREAQHLVEEGAGKVKCRFEVVGCLADLHRLLDEESYDVLIISAHGISNGRMAGLRIGRDNVYDLKHGLPPVVFFSACEVWPRGGGVVSVADLALRLGALAVLGTLVPIRVTHNPFVISRIFTYIIESIHRREPHLNLADAVARALASNAVLDVLHGAPRMLQWGFSPGPHGQPCPQVEFMSTRANGRLRASHVYEDTEKILIEIAEGHGPQYGRYVREFLKNSSYVPESLFYVMIGCPEQIILQPRVPGEDTIHKG